MLNKIIVSIVLSFLTSLSYAADKNTVDVTSEFIMPDDMKDCKIYRMNSEGFGSVYLYVTRCPNAKIETTKLGKASTTVLSGDGEK